MPDRVTGFDPAAGAPGHPAAGARDGASERPRADAPPGRASGHSSVVVHLKPHEEESEHVAVAVRLAASRRACLTGLFVQREPSVLKAIHPPRTLPPARLAAYEAQAAEAGRRFRARASLAGVEAEFHVAEGDAAELLGFVGRLHDLVVVEQTNLEHDEIGFDVPEHCVAATGRPVLVVPHAGRFPEVGRHVLVAWNGSREASLAVQHALPFIRAAERVTLLEGGREERFPSVTRWPAIGIGDYLGRLARRFEAVPSHAGAAAAGPLILGTAAQRGCDLVVMGAYGRSWLHEWVLGGATRHVLRHARVPLLLAN